MSFDTPRPNRGAAKNHATDWAKSRRRKKRVRNNVKTLLRKQKNNRCNKHSRRTSCDYTTDVHANVLKTLSVPNRHTSTGPRRK